MGIKEKRRESRAFCATAAGMLLLLLMLAFSPMAYADDTLGISIYGDFEVASTRGMLDRINDLRQNDAWYWNPADTEKIYVENLEPLIYDYALERVAMQRAAELAVYFSHTRPNGTPNSTAFPAAFEAGYNVENVAYGYRSADEAFAGWAEAENTYSGQGHRRNMLSARVKAVGIGCFRCGNTLFWAQAFSSVVSNSAEDVLSAPVYIEVLRNNISGAYFGKSQFLLEPGQSLDLLSDIDFYVISAIDPKLSVPCSLASFDCSLADTSIASLSGSTLTALRVGNTTLTAAMSDLSASTAITVEQTDALAPGQSIELELAAGEARYLSFIPQEDGDYVFSSTGGYDTFGAICDANRNILVSDNDSGDGYNFSVHAELTTGTQYYLGFCFNDINLSATVTVELDRFKPFSYTVLSDGTARITDCHVTGDVVIPSTIDGYTVSNLTQRLFWGESYITSVTIPATVTYFGNDKTDNSLDYVFADCFHLKNIYVDPENPAFRSVDGVLYSRDGQTLISYPCNHPGKTYHTDAAALGGSAFDSCNSLRFLFLENPDAVWKSNTFSYTGAVTTFYQEGGSAAQKAKSEIESGREHSSSSNYCKLLSTADIQTLPADLTEIEAEAFRGTEIRYLIIPDSCTKIESGAFTDGVLEYVSLPRTTAANGAFGSSAVVEYR